MSDAVIAPGPDGVAERQAREIAELREEVARLRARLGLRDAPRVIGMKLKDVLVFVMATAVGLAILRANLAGFTRHLPDSPVNTTIWSSRLDVACHAYLWSGPVAVMWTLSALYFRLRKPRPRIRRLIRRPGFAMTFTSAFAFLAVGAIFHLIAYVRHWPILNAMDASIAYAAGPAGFAAGSAWLVAALGGHRFPARDHHDWTGWLLGLYWLGMIPASLLPILAS